MEPEASSAQATLAHYWDDAPTEILIGTQKDSNEKHTVTQWPTAVYALVIAITVFWISHYLNVWRRSRREKAFQRELRRRHGIPDSDTRPFNIAYQAASIAARDAKRQSQPIEPERHASVRPPQNSITSIDISEGFRPQARARPPIPNFPGQPPVHAPSGSFTFVDAQPHAAATSANDLARGYSHHPHSATTPSWGPAYEPNGSRATSVPTVPTVLSRSAFAIAAASASRRSNGIHGPTSSTADRRTWSSATRPVVTSNSTGRISQARVRKRLYLTADEEADDQQSGVPNDKRSRTDAWGADAMIDGDNEPLWAQSYPTESKPVPEQYAPQSGKTKGKRLAEDTDGDLDSGGKRRQTKSSRSDRPQPSVIQETRGTKRERKEIDTASALNDVMPAHKRGRAGDLDLSMVQEEDEAEEDDPTISRDPLCGGRRIGQKWTANGQEFMVGANGERLRFTTVKESRKRYYMPADSKHADNSHMVEVFVEKWLNDEQYAKAKADGLLAWQGNENLPKDAKNTPVGVTSEGKENQSQDGQSSAVSTTAITVSRAQRTANTIWNTPGQSPMTNHSLTNPLNTPSSATTPESSGHRRVRYSMGTLPPSSNRAISVWEKQEKEAAALKILRERRRAEAAKAELASAPAPTPATIPQVVVTAPSFESATSKIPSPSPSSGANPPAEGSPFSFAPKPAGSTSVPNDSNTFAPQKDGAPKSTIPAASTPAVATPTPALFQPSSSTAVTAPPASTPSIFAAPAATVAPTSSPFGTSAQAPASKSSQFSFPAPPVPTQPTNTAASFSAPAPATAAPAAPVSSNPALPPFGTTPAAPSPAATKPMGGFTFSSNATQSTPATSNSFAFGAQTPKPAGNTFQFGSTNNSSGGGEAKPTTSGFSFGGETKPATAGGVGTNSSNIFGSGPTSTTNAFGSNGGTTSAAPFGSNGTAATSSSFAFNTSKPTGANVNTSGFGTTTAPSAPVFGTQAPTATPAAFSFGATNGNSTAPQAPGSSFGPPKPTVSIPTTNVFGPSTSTPTAAGSPFTFGAGPPALNTNGAAASPATPAKPIFNLGAAASPVMGTRQISTSKRVQRAMSKPPQ